jgi:hypothetical protein
VPVYGVRLLQRTEFPSGTIYPILARLERAGWITGQQEASEDASRQGRPARRLHCLTADGAVVGRFALAELTAAWPSTLTGSPLSMTRGSVRFLPVAVLLPPVYALITPAPFVALGHWHQDSHVYRRVFSAAALGLAFGAVSELAHGAAPLAAGHAIPPGVTLVRIPRLGVPGNHREDSLDQCVPATQGKHSDMRATYVRTDQAADR